MVDPGLYATACAERDMWHARALRAEFVLQRSCRPGRYSVGSSQYFEQLGEEAEAAGRKLLAAEHFHAAALATVDRPRRSYLLARSSATLVGVDLYGEVEE